MYSIKNISPEELKGFNQTIDKTLLYAVIDDKGKVLYLSKKFQKLLNITSNQDKKPIEELMTTDEGQQIYLKELIQNRKKNWSGEIEVTTRTNAVKWLEMSINLMHNVNLKQETLILCSDITERKHNEVTLEKISKKEYDEKTQLQKTQSSQIVEAQEEERKRIAKDIHDGIGQTLTALKFSIESINTSNIEATFDKVTQLKEGLGFLIKEVRSVTFNLTPPELSDYGIVPALNKLVIKLSDFTGKNIYFENKTDFKGRFDSLVETNLYRVVQEAVNNALKYAASNYILITLSHSVNKLSIVIDDDGKGFDYQKLTKKGKESGMGLFFMKERISYINGRLFINSEKNEGTRITINIDLDKT